MEIINLKYGRSEVPFEFDPDQFVVLEGQPDKQPLTDAQIGDRLDSPMGTPPVEDLVRPGESVLFVVPDATRKTGCGQVINLLVRRLIANGTAPHDIRIIFATGIHRKVTDAEKAEILTLFIAQRIKTLDHEARDLAGIVRFGETAAGIPIELNRAIAEHDHVITIGGISFHYFAGFTGGRKLICPGLGSSRTIAATHKLAFDCDLLARREGVDTGLLDGNAVHEAFIEIVEKAPPAFSVNTIVNASGEVTELYCGAWIGSHLAACESYAAQNTITVAEKRDLVVASCGGYPHDINLIQAHKTLDAASRACTQGGTIILLAACEDGLGRKDFANWFEARDSRELAVRLCEKYQVNGQTAWSLLRKAEQFDIRVASELESRVVAKLRLAAIDASRPDEWFDKKTPGYLIPGGSKLHIKN